MDEVDKILIHSLRLSGTQVPEEVQSLQEFTTELIVESVVRCLRVIHPSLGTSLSHVLPPGMSARFRIGTSLAQACQELGYQGEVGYQTFLYSSEPEIRRLLLFLVEKLPRDDAEDARQPAGKSAGLLRAIAAKIKEELGTPWVPPACRTPRLQRLQVGPPPPQIQTHVSSQRALYPPHSRPSPRAHLPRPPLSPPQEVQARQEEELAGLRGELQRLEAEMDAVGGEVKVLELSLSQVRAGLRQQRLALGGREQTLQVKSRALELLPQAENNLAKLQLLVESSAQRLVHLAAQWETRRGPLMDQYRHLRAARHSCQLESTRRVSEIQALHERGRSAATEARRKEELCRQLLTELESLPKDVSRAAYTQRILEIVGNIRKQKEEITKILSATRALQKEINSLTGKLDRTFAVTDELVFKDAKRDESVRKAYKYLAALHENCSQLIQTIEDAGAIQREIRDLEEQIESEGAKKTLANLERILSDYRALRQENAALLGRSRDP
uniref:Coiled-coil domain-containing protein 22 n=1 Tax=Gopherus agassizii TaxID=38772 RepID=A0A452J0J3_9SAUR